MPTKTPTTTKKKKAKPTASKSKAPAAKARTGAAKPGEGAKSNAGNKSTAGKSSSKSSTTRGSAAKPMPMQAVPRSTNRPIGFSAAPTSARPARQAPAKPIYVPRALPVIDDDDGVLITHGAGGGAGYGRCGGRMLGSMLEQTICDRLGQAGVAHSHSPRHFEVSLIEKQVAAYAPMIVLRGRGREGKSVVVEAAEDTENPILSKVVAFRRQYGQEYYVIFVAPSDVLDEVELATYDEGCAATDINTLIARLAE